MKAGASGLVPQADAVVFDFKVELAALDASTNAAAGGTRMPRYIGGGLAKRKGKYALALWRQVEGACADVELDFGRIESDATLDQLSSDLHVTVAGDGAPDFAQSFSSSALDLFEL